MFFGPMCQSCGMPISKDKKGGGSERDGSISRTYCSHCYARGTFVEPQLTAFEMMEKVRFKMSAMGIPDFLSRFFTKRIINLKRWKRS